VDDNLSSVLSEWPAAFYVTYALECIRQGVTPLPTAALGELLREIERRLNRSAIDFP